MPELVVSSASHYFVVTNISVRAQDAVRSFAKKMVQMGFVRNSNRYIYAAIKTFAASTADRSEYRFHINKLNDFKEHLVFHHLVGDLVEFRKIPIPTPVDINIKLKDHWVARPDQVPAIDYILSNDDPIAKFIDMDPGTGKSFVFMKSTSIIGHRVLLIVRPMYIDKWVKDMHRTFDMEETDVMVIQGSKELKKLLELATCDLLDAKIILISNKTIQNWIKLYEKFKYETLTMGYDCTPDLLCEHLGIGLRGIDELHQDFHLQFKIDCYTNVLKSVSLSATLLSDDDFINGMYEVMHPAATRFKGKKRENYVASTAVFYKLKHPNKVRYKDGVSKNYNHHLLEQSILRSDSLTENYLNLINTCIKGTYLKNYKEGQRCLIFCISIEMCNVVLKFLREKYPDKDIRRYVEDDPLENVLEADITVSTMQSSGTAIDVDNLSTVLMTIAMASSQGNIQGFGRLRPLKDDSTPEFVYLVCEDISKHTDYHERKRVILNERAKSYRAIYIPGLI